jgi:putative membrane protein
MRAALLGAGGAVLLFAWLWPAPAPLWPFADHMVRHMAVVALAAPLLALAMRGMALPAMPALLATLVEFAAVWGWHLPAAHAAAQTSAAAFAAEQASFLGAGLVLWLAVLHPGRQLAGAGAMLLTSMHMTLLGALLILAQRALYPSAICGGPADQQLGGMIMLGLGTPIYLVAGLILTARALAHAERAA